MIQVFIDGAEGTTGLRLHDRLSARDDVHLLSIDASLRKDPAARAKISSQADVVFLCLPDAAAKEAVQAITSSRPIIIDASTAHRTHPDWAYGLPELSPLHRTKIADSKRIANPGCHASGFLALAYPLIAQGIVDADYPFTAHSVTGYSGAGKSMIAQYADLNRAAYYNSPRQYALAQQHKHLPEMQLISGAMFPPQFSPIIADFYAGMVVTIPLHTRLMRKKMCAQELQRFFAEYYAAQTLVRVQDWDAQNAFEGGMINTGALAGQDYMEIFVCGHTDQTVLLARFDNLGKGASGAAIQCMNIACGCEETRGLSL